MPNPKLFMIISFCFLSVGAQTIYNVDTTNQTYNFTTHDFDGTVGGLPGVAFRFTAPSAGGFAIIVEDVESTSKYILDYGTDQTFNTYGTVIGGATGTMTMAFTASSAGEIHYFSVYTGTSSYYTNNFKIRYKTALTLTINNDGHGTTTPSGATAVASSIGQTISASPVSGYRFSHWSVTSGSATFADSTLYSTTVTITSNATIRANFKTGTVYQITNSNQTYNFTTHYYTGASPGTLPGVAFRFTAPSAGSYAIIVGDVDSTYKYLYDYGSDASFGS
ncbi:MAG: hypothetical protein JW913_13655, partial [Chitinispirillaceae bacterium]|nr:hypothetical protein [Chitinispirillaceae bacterium]